MKKYLLILFLLLCCIPTLEAEAKNYKLKNGKEQAGKYAGDGEDVYNYYRVRPSKDGYIAITVKTSNKKNLLVDICDSDKNVVASNISIGHKKTVLHKVEKKKIYFIRIKGTPKVRYKISYKINTFGELSYAEEYTYTFTNASFKSKSDSILLEIDSSLSGNLNFMCKTSNPITVQYLNSKKKQISGTNTMKKYALSGIGVKSDRTYYIRIWNEKKTTSGTTTITDMKYQINSVSPTTYSSIGYPYYLYYNTYKESLVPADSRSTHWYKIKLTTDQKLSIHIESRMLQMNGSCLKLDLYNRDGKKITSESIQISDEAYATYRKGKYKMNYPVKCITTGTLPKDTYYIKVASYTKKTSGFFPN